MGQVAVYSGANILRFACCKATGAGVLKQRVPGLRASDPLKRGRQPVQGRRPLHAQADGTLSDRRRISPICQALISIPGVGVQTSAAFAVAVADASRLKLSRMPGAYLGLFPDGARAASSTGRVGSPARATAWSASCSSKRQN